MKIRKLIFSAKLEQIEKQNQKIFIFHCSANASQWRFLKNFLFFYGQLVLANKTSEISALEGPTKVLFEAPLYGPGPITALAEPGPSLWVRRREPAFFAGPLPRVKTGPLINYAETPQAENTDSSAVSRTSRNGPEDRLGALGLPQSAGGTCPPSFRLGCANRLEAGSLLRGYTYFQSTKKNPVKVMPRSHEHSKMGVTRTRDLAVAPLFSTNKPKPAQPVSGGPKGCLFFFDTRSNTQSHQKKVTRFPPESLTRLELVNKTLRALEFNNNLILLYGQMNSTVLNHVDIKETLILDAQSTYEKLFLSLHSLSIALNFCLHQKIDEFFYVQETIPKTKGQVRFGSD